MAFNKRTWLGRQGTGLNKFSIGGASPVTIVNQPDSVTQVGDALSAGNLNDLEDRIEDAFDDVDTELATKADEQDVTNLNNALTALDHRLENIEQSKGDYIVSAYKDGSITPSGKGKWCVVEGVEGVSRVENNIITNGNFESASGWSFAIGGTGGSYSVADNIAKIIFGSNNSIFQIYKAGSYLGFSYTSGHSYLVFVKVRLSVNASVRVVQYETNNIHYGSNITVSANQWTLIPLLFTANASGQFETNVQSIGGMSQGDVIEAKEFVVTDLSVYFAGDPSVNVSSLTIADIQTNYPHLLLPSDYGTRIVDWTGNEVRAWSANLLNLNRSTIITSADGDASAVRIFTEDQIWVGLSSNNYFSNVSITSYSVGTDSVTVNTNNSGYGVGFPVKCKPSTAYYMSQTSAYNIGIGYFDANGNYIDQEYYFTNKTFTTPANCYWMCIVFRPVINVSSTYTNPMLNIGSTALTYSRYFVNTLSFPSISLKSAGSVRDTLELNVEVDGVAKKRETEKTATVDLETLAWTVVTGTLYSATLAGVKGPSSSDVVGDMTCDKYIPSYSSFLSQRAGMIAVADNEIRVNTGSASTPSGTLTYARQEPVVTLSDPILDNTLLTESGGRMATVQTGTVVDGIADLGFITL